MAIRPAVQKMAIFIEFFVGAGLAIFFHLVLEDHAAALIIFGIGLLLSVATWLIREEVSETRERLLDDYREFHSLPDVMRRIDDPECQIKARQIIARVTRNMSLLQRGFIPMDETEFMLEATRAADAATSSLKSVNPLTPGWDTRGAIIKYYQANCRAIARGVRIVRTFVLRREQLAEPEVQKMLMTHYRDGIEVRLVYRDELPAGGEAGWARDCSFNFGIFDDRQVVDVSAPAPYYGVRTSQPDEVARYLKLLDFIDHASHAVRLENDTILQE